MFYSAQVTMFLGRSNITYFLNVPIFPHINRNYFHNSNQIILCILCHVYPRGIVGQRMISLLDSFSATYT